jgi:hypothetical protein
MNSYVKHRHTTLVLLLAGLILGSTLTPITARTARANSDYGVILYEDNRCEQDIVKVIQHEGSYNLKNERGKNDEASSIRFQNVVSLRVIVYDSPKGSRNDDWTEIEYYEGTDVCISSFEGESYGQVNSAGSGYNFTHHHKNGLDGKVSRVEVYIL